MVNHHGTQPSVPGTLLAMARALVLNATYEPLAVVSTRRAVVLVLRSRADVIASQTGIWRSERKSLVAPAVVRLRSYVRVPRHRPVSPSRRSVFFRDGHSCQYCGNPAENLDHVVPKSQGGEHTWENVVAACRRCNSRKGGRTPRQAGLRLRRTPESPVYSFALALGLVTVPQPEWEPYLDLPTTANGHAVVSVAAAKRRVGSAR